MLDQIAAAIVAHRVWAGPVIGLLAFGESLAVVGTLIPATPALFLIGTLLGSGALDAFVILPFAIVGAITGYWASWAFGRRIGHRAYTLPILIGNRRKIARVRLYFRRWGGPALIFGRYLLGPFQSALPLIAGVAGMGARRFHVWNSMSGVLWVAVVFAPGFLAARGIRILGLGPQQQRWLVEGVIAISIAAVLAVIVRMLWGRGSGSRRNN